ncbi:MAG TPA: DNA translocase FtsK [Desulfosporosinus sp.]|nr:DNA translocase FtsK [Desulfosporosinus sp.]
MDEQKVFDLMPKVIELAKKQKAEGSTITVNLLQRRLRIGYILGAMCMDKMEELGHVGPFNAVKGREILL